MSTGLQNGLSSAQNLPLQSENSSILRLSAVLRDQVFATLEEADIKTLREVICHCNKLINVQQNNSKSVLFKQFSVTPNILSHCYGQSNGSVSNETGTLISPSAEEIKAGHGTPKNIISNASENLITEVKSLGLEERSGSTSRRKVASQWLIKNPQNTNLPSEDMAKFPAITSLCSALSEYCGNVDFNSCIVNYYADGSARTRPHSDDESYIVQDCPIVCFSIGSNREIGIYDKATGELVGKHTLEDGSLLTMNPGAQANKLTPDIRSSPLARVLVGKGLVCPLEKSATLRSEMNGHSL